MSMKDFVQNVQEYSARGQDYIYKPVTDDATGTTVDLISPQSGYYTKIVGFVISTTGAGVLEIKFNDETVIHLEFNQRKSEPFTFPFPIKVNDTTTVKAYFKADSGTVTCYITAIYHYEKI